ncbi:MAG: prepilin peptidase, partial [Planctomycetota bacterium]
GGSIVSPPSRCPTCAGRLSWRENLPVLGWLLLRGRCRFCGERIGVQYLLVELLLGGLFVAVFLVCYLPDAGDWWTLGTGDWWTRRQLGGSWPGFLVILSLFSLLVPITDGADDDRGAVAGSAGQSGDAAAAARGRRGRSGLRGRGRCDPAGDAAEVRAASALLRGLRGVRRGGRDARRVPPRQAGGSCCT